jgi:hypothetical protein
LGTLNRFCELREPFGAQSGNLFHLFPPEVGTLSAAISFILNCLSCGEGMVHCGAETV